MRGRRGSRNRRSVSRNRRGRNQNQKFVLYGILCVVLMTLIVSGIFLWRKAATAEKPEELLLEYMGYIQSKEYEKMYEMLDSQSKETISEKDFIERNQNIYEGIRADSLLVTIQEVDDSNKPITVVDYHTTFDSMAGKIEFDNQAVFIKEKKIGQGLQWNHAMIVPNLEETDKVKTSTAQAKRGSIYDRNELLLAGAGTASAVGFVPGKMTKDAGEDSTETDSTETESIVKMAELLEVSPESIEKKLSAKWVKDDSFVPIKNIQKLEDTELVSTEPNEETLQKKALEEELLAIPGVMITDTNARVYPLGKKAAHLIGYVQNITAEDLEADEEGVYNANSQIGKVGLEVLYEERLRGKNGGKIAIVDQDGNEKEVLAEIPVQDGENIRTTIDAKLQIKLYEEYQEDKSCSVAMNPMTGEVLALISTPAFDNNDFVMGMSVNKWNLLNEDESKPLYNRFRATWSPGSSFKSVIGAIGVSAGKIDPGEDFGASGLSWQKDNSWGAYKVTTLHEYQNAVLQNALIYSDNIYFAKAALKIGKDTLEEKLKKIGFMETLPFAIKMTESTFSNEEKIKTEIQLADSGYGQGEILVNPLHLAVIYSALLNEGNMIEPYLEQKEQEDSTYWKEGVFTQEAADIVKEALVQVVENEEGTAHAVKTEGILIGAKTGTAEIKASKEDTSGTELGWLAAFTADTLKEKSWIIVTMVEDVKERGGSGYIVGKNKAIFEELTANK